MKNVPITAFFAATMLFSVPSHAQTAGAFMTNPAFQGPRPARCITTIEMQRCAADDLRSADAEMGRRYNILRAHLPAKARQALLTEQRAWLRARDRDCLKKASGGGSIASLNVARCWVDRTEARVTALAARMPAKTVTPHRLSASDFVGRWRGGEGTYMKITQRGNAFVIDNQWGLDADMRDIIANATLGPDGLHFRRRGVAKVARPSRGDAIALSALRGKTDCLKVARDEGYCRY